MSFSITLTRLQGIFSVLRYLWSAIINYNTDSPRFCTPHSSSVIVQYLYIGPDTIQPAQRHCLDKSVAQVKGTEVYMGFILVSAKPDFLTDKVSVDSSTPWQQDYGGPNWWTLAKLASWLMWVALQWTSDKLWHFCDGTPKTSTFRLGYVAKFPSGLK